MKSKYIACCSGGKDSVATLILTQMKGEPLDEVVYAEVMFDPYNSGELPDHSEFIHGVLSPWVENTLGVPFTIVRGEVDYSSYLKHRITRGSNSGFPYGFVLSGACSMNAYGKLRPLKKYLKSKYGEANLFQYVGIAHDEKSRLEALSSKVNCISLLDKYGFTEEMAVKLCKEHGLYSPGYQYSHRNGCWFCPNAKDGELAHMIETRPDLVYELIKIERWLQSHGGKYPYKKNISFNERVQKIKFQGLIRRVLWF